MIVLKHNSDCCGCWACVQRCPKHCISMKEDEEGFLYPVVDTHVCISCGLCEQVCPVINQSAPRKPIHVYAAKNRNEAIREKSSSGGIFTPLAENIISQRGVVFGAKFDPNWNVVHTYTETIEGLADFRGSKYVQSTIGECYRQAEDFLKLGRKVLFSGTPCQIAGLHKFLMREYPNLLTVDLVCHGVPSPMIWREYLKSLIRPKGAAGENSVLSSLNSMSEITGIRFRDKRLGWGKYGFEIRWSAIKADKNTVLKSGKNSFFEPLTENLFMQGFLKDLYLRPSCHVCPARQGKSGSDLTIADFWGIANYFPKFDDDRGVSLVFMNTEKGVEIYKALHNEQHIDVTYGQALAGNPCLEHSAAIPECRSIFWDKYAHIGTSAIFAVLQLIRPSLLCRILNRMRCSIKLLAERR